MLRINVVTLFPDWFTAPLSSSILGRAAAAGLVQYRVVQLRALPADAAVGGDVDLFHLSVAAPR